MHKILLFIVVDVYQQWSSPCKAIEGVFRKIKLDSGDPLLRFTIVKFLFFFIYNESDLHICNLKFYTCTFQKQNKKSSFWYLFLINIWPHII
jgi:hypothetical protein